MFVLQNFTMKPSRLSSLASRPVGIHTGTAEVDLTLTIVERKDTLIATLTYNTALFNATTVAKMLNRYCTLLKDITANVDQCLSNLRLMTMEETAGYTPSDFAEAQLSQEGFERLVVEINKSFSRYNRKVWK